MCVCVCVFYYFILFDLYFISKESITFKLDAESERRQSKTCQHSKISDIFMQLL